MSPTYTSGQRAQWTLGCLNLLCHFDGSEAFQEFLIRGQRSISTLSAVKLCHHLVPVEDAKLHSEDCAKRIGEEVCYFIVKDTVNVSSADQRNLRQAISSLDGTEQALHNFNGVLWKIQLNLISALNDDYEEFKKWLETQ